MTDDRMSPDPQTSQESRDLEDLDLTGLQCPLPVLYLRKALDRARPGTVFTVRVSDPMAKIDLPHLCQTTGDAIDGPEDEGTGRWRFTVRKV